MNRMERNVLPLKEVIYQELKNKILNLEYKPGQMISETEISDLLKVSRTPVREVFIRLSHEKLINIYPQKGTFVSLIDLSYVSESVFMRNLLENQIVREIMEKGAELPPEIRKNLRQQKEVVEEAGTVQEFLDLDNEYHRMIFKAADHAVSWDILSTTRIHYNRYRVLTMYLPEMLGKVYNEHCQLVELIRDRDTACYSILKRHHYSGLDHPKALKEKYPDYFL